MVPGSEKRRTLFRTQTGIIDQTVALSWASWWLGRSERRHRVCVVRQRHSFEPQPNRKLSPVKLVSCNLLYQFAFRSLLDPEGAAKGAITPPHSKFKLENKIVIRTSKTHIMKHIFTIHPFCKQNNSEMVVVAYKKIVLLYAYKSRYSTRSAKLLSYHRRYNNTNNYSRSIC